MLSGGIAAQRGTPPGARPSARRSRSSRGDLWISGRPGSGVAASQRATPGGQLCTADDVADVTELLLGSKTRRVNGAIWVVDGGLSGTVDGLLPSAPGANHSTHGHDARALLARMA